MSFNLPNKSNLDVSDTFEFWDRSGSDPQKVEITQENLKNNLEGYTGNLSTVSDLNDSDTYVVWDKSGASPQKSEITRENVIDDVSQSDAYNGRSIVTEGGSRSAASNSTALNDTLSKDNLALIPEGTWNFDTTQQILPRRQNITILGSGIETTVLKRTNGVEFFNLGESGNDSDEISEIVFKDMTIDMNDGGQRAVFIDGAYNGGSDWSDIRDIKFENVRFTGLTDGTGGGDRFVWIRGIIQDQGITFENCTWDMKDDQDLMACYVSQNAPNQNYLPDDTRLAFRECDFTGGATGIRHVLTTPGRGVPIEVTSCEFRNMTKTFWKDNDSTTDNPRGIAGYFYHNGGLHIENNKFVNCKVPALQNSDGGLLWCDGATYQQGDDPNYNDGIFQDSSSYNVIGNHFRSNVGNAIYTEDCKGGSIQGNKIVDQRERVGDSDIVKELHEGPNQNVRSHGGHGIIVGGGIEGVSFGMNGIQNIEGHGIFASSELSAKVSGDALQRLSIISNFIADVGQNVGPDDNTGTAIRIVDFGRESEIVNNKLRNTGPETAIIDVDTGADEFVVDGDKRSELTVGNDITVFDSSGNDPAGGNTNYEVSGYNYDSGTDETTISTVENISDSTADGFISFNNSVGYGIKFVGANNFEFFNIRIIQNAIRGWDIGLLAGEQPTQGFVVSHNNFVSIETADISFSGFVGVLGPNSQSNPANMNRIGPFASWSEGEIFISDDSQVYASKSGGLEGARPRSELLGNTVLKDRNLQDGEKIMEWDAHRVVELKKSDQVGTQDSGTPFDWRSAGNNSIRWINQADEHVFGITFADGNPGNVQIGDNWPPNDRLDVDGTLRLRDQGSDPVKNGQMQVNSGDIKVYSGGGPRNLTKVGTFATKLTQSISDPPTQAEVQNIQDKVNAIIDDIGY